MTRESRFDGPVARTLNALAIVLNEHGYAQNSKSPVLSEVQASLLQKCDPLTHLVIYGSLAPGESNHNQIVHVRGTYHHGNVQGTLLKAGWGEHIGFPGLIWGLDVLAQIIPVQIMHAHEMHEHWHNLDEFEGIAYRRIIIPYLLDIGKWGLGCAYQLNVARQ